MDKAEILDAAREALEEKRYDEAIAIVEEILSEGVDLEALEVKGDAFRLKGEPKEAMKCYDRALVIDLQRKTIWKSKGFALLAAGRQDEALRSFDKCVKIDPNYVEGWLGRGRMGMKMHDWDMALESFEKVTALDPDNDSGWYNKANALITGYGRMEEAINCYKKAIDLFGESDEYWFSLGVAYKSMGSHRDAAENFKVALKYNNSHSMARKYLDECAAILASEGEDTAEFAGAADESGDEPPIPPAEGNGEEEDEDDWGGEDGGEEEGSEPPAPPTEREEDEEDWGAPPIGASDEKGFFTDWVNMEGDSFAFDPPAPPPEEEERDDDGEDEGDLEEDGQKAENAVEVEDDEGEEDWGTSPIGASDEDGFFTDWVDMEGDSFAFDPPAPPPDEEVGEEEEEEKEEVEDEGPEETPGEDENGGEEDALEFEMTAEPETAGEEGGEVEFIEEEVVEMGEEETPDAPPVEDWADTPVGATDEKGFFTDWVDMEESSFAFEITEEPETEEDEEVEFIEEEEDE